MSFLRFPLKHVPLNIHVSRLLLCWMLAHLPYGECMVSIININNSIKNLHVGIRIVILVICWYLESRLHHSTMCIRSCGPWENNHGMPQLHLTRSSIIKLSINIKPTWISTHGRMGHAICRWLKCVKICQNGKGSCLFCVLGAHVEVLTPINSMPLLWRLCMNIEDYFIYICRNGLCAHIDHPI